VLRGWLEQRDAIWIEIPGFDELMLLFKSEFSIPNPTSTKFDRLFSNYLGTYAELERQVGQIPDTDPQASSLKGAAARVEDSAADWSALYMRAVRAEAEDPAEAERLYREGIAEFPRSVWSFIGLSRLMGRRGRHAEALELSDKAVELEPDNQDAMLTHGEMLAIVGRMQDALDTFKTVVEQEPDAILPRTYYGVFSARAGKREEAKEQLAILLDPDQGPLTGGELGAAALLADECGNYELALGLHERALAENPDNSVLRARFVRCLIALGRIDDARIEVAQALDGLSPSNFTGMMQCYFYEVAIGTQQQANAALVRLKRMISDGVRLTTWPLGAVVAASRREGNTDAEWIERLAAVIGGRNDPSELDSWSRWREAG
jgi:tetratricopeptide (TPR) repeat protein